MAFASMTMRGGADLAAALRALPVELSRRNKLEALQTAAVPMQNRMIALAPRGDDPPHLSDNIEVNEVKKIDGQALGDQEVAVAIGPSRGYFYGLMWEYGWATHPAAHPFARPAFDGEHENSLRLLGIRLWEILRR